MRLGKHQKALMEFANRVKDYGGGWHSFNMRCATTRRTVKSLVSRGLLETNGHDQFRSLEVFK